MNMPAAICKLLDEPCLSVNFSLQGALITGSGFRLVKQRLTSAAPGQKIDCELDPTQKSPASYRRFCDRFDLRRVLSFKAFNPRLLSSIAFRAAIAHECAHALLDVTGADKTTVLTHETTGYILESIYGLSNAPIQWRLEAGKHPIRAAAIRLIEKFKLVGPRCSTLVVLSWKDYSELRATIHKDRMYSHLGDKERWG